MNRSLKMLAAVVLILAVAVSIGVFWIPALLQTPEVEKSTTPATNVEQISPQYLPGYVLQPISNTSYGGVFESSTRIFLVFATTYYGYSNSTIKSISPYEPNVVNKGDPIFILNVTLRNDYNDQNPLPLTSSPYHAFVFLTATLYSKNGSVIDATDVSPTTSQVGAQRGAFLGFNGGDTAPLELCFATGNRNIGHYVFHLSVFGIPPP